MKLYAALADIEALSPQEIGNSDLVVVICDEYFYTKPPACSYSPPLDVRNLLNNEYMASV